MICYASHERSCTSALRIIPTQESGKVPLYSTGEGGETMMPPLGDYQRVLFVVWLWGCVLRPHLWPAPPVARPSPQASPSRPSARAPTRPRVCGPDAHPSLGMVCPRDRRDGSSASATARDPRRAGCRWRRGSRGGGKPPGVAPVEVHHRGVGGTLAAVQHGLRPLGWPRPPSCRARVPPEPPPAGGRRGRAHQRSRRGPGGAAPNASEAAGFSGPWGEGDARGCCPACRRGHRLPRCTRERSRMRGPWRGAGVSARRPRRRHAVQQTRFERS